MAPAAGFAEAFDTYLGHPEFEGFEAIQTVAPADA